MVDENIIPKPRLVRTPLYKIPIGEAVKLSDGRYSLRFKRSRGSEYEEVPLERIISMVIMEAETRYGTVQAPRNEGVAAGRETK